MEELKISVSGIRGIWGKSLKLELIFNYVKAFGYYIKKNNGKRILLGRDGRLTGKLISNFCSSILNAMGIDVFDCGIIPTPSVLFGVRYKNYDGGIIITASHNPIEWNALKFVKKGGVFFDNNDIEQLVLFYDSKLNENIENVGNYYVDDSIMDLHIDSIIKNINSELIKKRRFIVVLDPVNSAGSIITQKLLIKLNCEIFIVNGEITGKFNREAEPTPKNLTHLTKFVVENNADIGFAQDPDADRLVVVDENGNILNEELTLALSLENILKKQKGNVVVNLSTSMINDWICNKYGVKLFRTKVGEANVVNGIIEHNAIIGGEGNGGIIFPKINIARDSLVGIGLILELLAETNQKLSEIVEKFPKYYFIKEKINYNKNINNLFNKLKEIFNNAKYNDLDGLRFDWDNTWIHIRSSNTEPVIRIIGESIEKEKLEQIKNQIYNIIKNNNV